MNKEHQDKSRTTNGENAERRGSGAQDPRETNAGQMAGNQRGNGQQGRQDQQQDAGRQERQGQRQAETGE
jgi:hypothetical protein